MQHTTTGINPATKFRTSVGQNDRFIREFSMILRCETFFFLYFSVLKKTI
jgi:hypothetical protein